MFGLEVTWRNVNHWIKKKRRPRRYRWVCERGIFYYYNVTFQARVDFRCRRRVLSHLFALSSEAKTGLLVAVLGSFRHSDVVGLLYVVMW